VKFDNTSGAQDDRIEPHAVASVYLWSVVQQTMMYGNKRANRVVLSSDFFPIGAANCLIEQNKRGEVSHRVHPIENLSLPRVE